MLPYVVLSRKTEQHHTEKLPNWRHAQELRDARARGDSNCGERGARDSFCRVLAISPVRKALRLSRWRAREFRIPVGPGYSRLFTVIEVGNRDKSGTNFRVDSGAPAVFSSLRPTQTVATWHLRGLRTGRTSRVPPITSLQRLHVFFRLPLDDLPASGYGDELYRLDGFGDQYAEMVRKARQDGAGSQAERWHKLRGNEEILARELTIDLFKQPPQRERIRKDAVRLATGGLPQRQIAARLTASFPPKTWQI